MSEAEVSAPVRLDSSHERSVFDCGTESLNDWFRSRALNNERSGASRTYVACEGPTVVGYYCLSSTHVVRVDAPKPVRCNAPDPIPATLMGRLAVDQRLQGRGLGKLLVRDAILRVLSAGEIVGTSLLVVDAISNDASRFYAQQGFLESATHPLTLYLPLAPLRARLAN